MIKLYFYNGFDNIKSIDIDNINIINNYMGDMTDDLLEEWEYIKKDYTLDDMIENQPLQSTYNIWINPTVEQLKLYNKSILLPINAYMDGIEW